MTIDIRMPAVIDLTDQRLGINDPGAEFIAKISTTQQKLEDFSFGLSDMTADLQSLSNDQVQTANQVASDKQIVTAAVAQVASDKQVVIAAANQAILDRQSALEAANQAENISRLVVGLAHYKGDWATLTATDQAVPLEQPASVSDAGGFWILQKDLIDARASKPSLVNSDWIEYAITAITARPVLSVTHLELNEYASAALQITDYDPGLSYILDTPPGLAVVRNGSSISVTALSTSQDHDLAITISAKAPGMRQSMAASLSVSVRNLDVAMIVPSVLSPATGTSRLDWQPVVTASAYEVDPAGFDEHENSQCQVLDSDGAVIWDSGIIPAVTEFAVDHDLPADIAIKIRVRYKGSAVGWGEWSQVVAARTRPIGGYLVVYPDGGIGGPIVGGYRLIVAPKSKRGANLSWGPLSVNVLPADVRSSAIADSWTGHHNTEVMISNHGSSMVAASYCKSLGDDWFLPNKDELAAIQAIKSDIDSADPSSGIAFSTMSDHFMWSSTEYNENNAWAINASTGLISNKGKNLSHYVVPVRREIP